jgi:hypothetical protein
MSGAVSQTFEEFTLVFADTRGPHMASRHASKWQDSKPTLGSLFLYTKIIPPCTKVHVRASLMSPADATVIVADSDDRDAESRVSNVCATSNRGVIGVILDRAHGDYTSAGQARLAALAAKHGGVFDAFSTTDADSLNAFVHQMVFLARERRRQIALRPPQGFVSPRMRRQQLICMMRLRCVCLILAGIVAAQLISWLCASSSSTTTTGLGEEG